MNLRIVFSALLAIAIFLAPATSRARWMDPNTGRFQTVDPYEGNQSEPLSLHRYVYTGNDPVNRVDPSGNFYDINSSSIAQTESAYLDAISAGASQVAKRQAAKSVATSIAKVTAATVGLLLLNGDDPSIEQSTDRRLNPTGSPHAYQNYKCEQFAADAYTYSLSKGKKPQRITYDSYTDKTFRDRILAIEGFGVFGTFPGGGEISYNRHHEGVLVDGMVFDNNVPFGVPRAMWENGYIVSPKDKPDTFLTLRQAHILKYGEINPP
jgi:hypothetical protein